MATQYRPGDAVSVIGSGVGRVVASNEKQLLVKLTEGEVGIRLDDAEAILRPIVGSDVAQRFLLRLCERCREERTLPQLRSIRELARAPLERQVEYSRWYFRSKKSLHPTEHEMILVVSENVVAELALALGVPESDLLAAVKRGKAEMKPRLHRELPAAPALANAVWLRSFWLGAIAIIGEGPERNDDVLETSVKPGAWHAFIIEDANDDEGLEHEGLLLHHANLGATRSSAIIDLGGVNLEGGTIGVLDKDALSDPEFGIDAVQRKRREGEGYGDRGVETPTNGDGDHRILVDRTSDATCVVIPF